MDLEREIDILDTFVLPRRRERFVGFLRAPRRRRDFLSELYHFSDFDPACIVPLAGACDSAPGLVAELLRRGAPRTCYVVSVDARLDGITADLAGVIDRVFAKVDGTLVSCVPGRLAYYEGEAPDNRFILERVRRR